MPRHAAIEMLDDDAAMPRQFIFFCADAFASCAAILITMPRYFASDAADAAV